MKKRRRKRDLTVLEVVSLPPPRFLALLALLDLACEIDDLRPSFLFAPLTEPTAAFFGLSSSLGDMPALDRTKGRT